MSTIAGSIIATQVEEMFSLEQAMQPKNVRITGGAVDGDSATP